MHVLHGDLIQLALSGEVDVLVHDMNCFVVFEPGLGERVKKAFPEAYRADLQTVKGDRGKLGSFSSARCVRPAGTVTVVNAYVQFGYGRRPSHLDLDAVRRCFEAVASSFPGARIAYPSLGGSAGAWVRVAPLIDRAFLNHVHTVVMEATPKAARKERHAATR